MPESSKTTLLELSARFSQDGKNCVIQRYPTQKHFLLVLPLDSQPAPVVWTSSNPKIMEGNTSISKLSLKDSIKKYNVPGAIIQPIQKSNRNSFTTIIVGRDESADIRLNSMNVSKFHSSISLRDTIEGEILQIRDSSSRNGTFVNENQLPQGDKLVELSPWTEIKFGDVRTLYLDLNGLLELLKTNNN